MITNCQVTSFSSLILYCNFNGMDNSGNIIQDKTKVADESVSSATSTITLLTISQFRTGRARTEAGRVVPIDPAARGK